MFQYHYKIINNYFVDTIILRVRKKIRYLAKNQISDPPKKNQISDIKVHLFLASVILIWSYLPLNDLNSPFVLYNDNIRFHRGQVHEFEEF